jgi:acylphosphatase
MSVRRWSVVNDQRVSRVIARVTGRVQGVNYRASARREALRLGLAGWARNESDGSVLIDVEGEPAAVQAFLDWCARGPTAATVCSIETNPAPPAGHEGFSRL